MRRRVLLASFGGSLALRRIIAGGGAVLLPARVLRAQGVVAAAPEGVRDDIARWLGAQGLAAALEVRGLGWVAIEDGTDRRHLQLELAFSSPPDEDKEAASERFDQWLASLRGPGRTDFVTALFYKLVLAADVRRADAALIFRVQDETYTVALDEAEGWPTMRGTTGRRRYVRRSVQLPAYGSATAAAARGGVALPAVGAALPERVQRFLKTFFERSVAGTGRPAPVIRLRPLEPGFAAVEAQGLRQLVLPDKNYWELLIVSIELHPAAEGQTSAACSLEGRFSAGLGDRPPPASGYSHDMDPRYRTAMETFADGLLRQLQEELARGAP